MGGFYRDLYDELKRRRVIRVATIYVVLFWPIVQIADILSPALDLPTSLMQILLIIFIAGFPVVLLLAWGFNLTPDGLVRASSANGDGDETILGRKTELIVICTLLAAVVVLYFIQDRMNLSGVSAQDQTPALEVEQPAQASSPDTHSIAVLPFVPFSQEQQDQYFADGLTEELLNVLSRVRSMRVAARTSSFAYRGVNRKVQEIGTELNVSYILEGSVRRNDVDDTVRVTAQLIDVNTGLHLWSQTFDREYRDIFKIQDEIAAAVVNKMEITLLAGEEDQLKSRASAKPEAMVAHSMGRTEMARRTAQSLEDAVRYFKKAIDEDPGYAEAHSGLADAYTLLASYKYRPSEETLGLAQAAVDNAMKLAPELGAAWASQGLIHLQGDREDDAREALTRAMEFNPSYAMAYMWYGNLCEDADERLENYQRALELDPRSPVAGYNVAQTLIYAGRESEAMDVFSQIVEADPYYPLAYQLVAQINQFRGRLDEAIVHYRKVYELQPDWQAALQIASIYFDLGDFDEGDRWLAAADESPPDDALPRLAWERASSLLARGDTEAGHEQMKPFMTVSTPSDLAYYSATLAAYFLDDPTSAITSFEQIENPELGKRLQDQMDLAMNASIAAAFAYKQLERQPELDALLKRINDAMDKMTKATVRIHPDTWYSKSLISAIEGEEQMAMFNLQRAMDEGWSQHWRPFVEPCLADVIANGNFQPMMAGLEARMNLMREQLAFEDSFGEDWRG